jgi:hypothetical protein
MQPCQFAYQSEGLNRFGLHKNETMKYVPKIQFVIEFEARGKKGIKWSERRWKEGIV